MYTISIAFLLLYKMKIFSMFASVLYVSRNSLYLFIKINIQLLIRANVIWAKWSFTSSV